MAFDSLTLTAVGAELQPLLAGARINKIHQPDNHTVLLRFHAAQGGGRLLLCAHPQNGRIHLTETARENPAKAPLFVMVLRKWLEGARICGLTVTPGERVAELTIESRDELGDPTLLRLVIEIMGKHSNIILVNANGLIIDGIRRYGSALSRYREVLPGRPYLPPPPFDKLPLLPADEQILAAALYEESDTAVAVALRRQVAGMSPLLSEHLTLTAGLDPTASTETLGAAEIDNLYNELSVLNKRIITQNFTPTLHGQNGRYSDFCAIAPICWPTKQQVTCNSMNEAVELFYAAHEAEQSFTAHKRLVSKQLSKHIARLNKKITLEELDLARAEAGDKYKETGDLLAANMWQLQKGMECIELPSFDDPEKMIQVEMDANLTPQENIQRCYRRYSKAKHARTPIEAQLTLNRDELSYLLSIDQAVADSADQAELAEPEREAAAAGYLPQPTTTKLGKKHAEAARPAALPPRRYRTDDGFTVLIGRNNKQNDRLSLKQASADDVWLHTQKIPGSHTIIVSEGRSVSEQALTQAASWAAWFSKARDSGLTPVDFLPAGKLKKPPGSRAGFVIYTGQKTLFVLPCDPGQES